MNKAHFKAICERNEQAMNRDPNAVGVEWLSPLLQIEAEQDRNDLILLCVALGEKLRSKK